MTNNYSSSTDDDSHIAENSENEMEALELEVGFIRANTISQNSRVLYLNSSVKFLSWLFDKKRNLLTEEYLRELNLLQTDKGLSSIKAVKHLLSRAPLIPPIRFNIFLAKDFMVWIASLKKPNGSKPGKSAYNYRKFT